MGWYLILPLSKIEVCSSLRIDGKTLIRVNNHAEESRIGIDKLGFVSNLKIVKYRRIIKIGQVRHVFALFELGRVDLSKFLILEDFFLKREIMILVIHNKL